MGLTCWGLSKTFTQATRSVIVDVARTDVYYEVEPIVAVTQMNASLIMVGLLFERWQSKRAFQTDLTQAFVAVRYRVLDLFSFDPLRLTFALQKLVFTETSFWLLFVSRQKVTATRRRAKYSKNPCVRLRCANRTYGLNCPAEQTSYANASHEF